MYFLMTIFTVLGLFGKISLRKTIFADLFVSLAGFLFAGNFVMQEILESKIIGSLGFSTCVYGLLFYIAIIIISSIALKKVPKENK